LGKKIDSCVNFAPEIVAEMHPLALDDYILHKDNASAIYYHVSKVQREEQEVGNGVVMASS
jgi:hypothetical protein